MGRLQGSTAYLSGPMDSAKDGGVCWRQMITPKLREMGVGVFNPADKPCEGYLEDFELRRQLNIAKEAGDYAKVSSLTKGIVGIDLRMVHHCSFMPMYIDLETFMFGTTVEFTWAIQQRKPVLMVCKQGIAKIPNFAWGMNPSQLMFNNFDEMLVYLHHIDNDKEIDDLRRWHFFDYSKVFSKSGV